MSREPIGRTARDAGRHRPDGADLAAVADWLGLAAAPVFALMALLSALPGSPTDMSHPAGHAASPAGGMTLMYALMSVFHSVPWVKLGRNRRAERGERAARPAVRAERRLS